MLYAATCVEIHRPPAPVSRSLLFGLPRFPGLPASGGFPAGTFPLRFPVPGSKLPGLPARLKGGFPPLAAHFELCTLHFELLRLPFWQRT